MELNIDPRLPRPTGCRLLVEVPKFEETDEVTRRAAAAGLQLLSDSTKREETATVVVRVLAAGPLAYHGEDFPPALGPWCKPGDYVILRAYSGTRFKLNDTDTEYRLVVDNAVEAVVPDPTAVSRAF